MKQQVEKQFQHDVRLRPNEVALPELLQAPIEVLGTPITGFVYSEPECQKLTQSRAEIQKHYYKAHNWKSSQEDPEHWHSSTLR